MQQALARRDQARPCSSELSSAGSTSCHSAGYCCDIYCRESQLALSRLLTRHMELPAPLLHAPRPASLFLPHTQTTFDSHPPPPPLALFFSPATVRKRHRSLRLPDLLTATALSSQSSPSLRRLSHLQSFVLKLLPRAAVLVPPCPLRSK